MKQNLLTALAAVLLAACVMAFYATRESGSAVHRQPGKAAQPLVDTRLLETAHRLASLAETPDEQPLARECLRLADHEVDLEFATKLREAASLPPPRSGPAKQLSDRIAALQKRVAADQASVEELSKQNSDGLDLAKARLALDQDELDDARQDLAIAGGDQHATLERALAEHENAQHESEMPKVTMAGRTGTLLQHLQLWLALGARRSQLDAARQQASDKAASLRREHDTLQKQTAGAAETVAGLRTLSARRRTATDLDKRVQDSQQLATTYQNWSAVIQARRRAALHLLLGSLALVFAIVLAVVLIGRGIRHAFRRNQDMRRIHQLRSMSVIAVQFVGVVLILIVVFGPPTQLSTIIGLTTAGLTVALKDFVVAFFGWFALLGRNGLRVGDWVEINGVGGEVIDIGLLKTTLLEMGDWTRTGHPTGRRVSFMNGFAIEGHYFNFSTAGQWLWDELQVLVPAAGDPYRVAQQIRETVERETESEVQEAELDWERATRQYGVRPFSARPAVDLRPSELGHGLVVAVRYITRAPQRYQVKSRLYEAIVGLMHGQSLADG